MHCDRSWTLTVLVISIIPDLRNSILRTLRSVRIGNGELINLSLIFRNCFFSNSIGNLLTCCILRKGFRLKLPIVSSCYFQLIYDSIAIFHLNLNRSWTLAILVISVIPDFLTGNLNHLWSVRVGNCEIFDFFSVASYIIFLDRVINLLTIFIDWQIFKFGLPLISSSHFLASDFCLDTADGLHQLNANLSWTLTVLIIAVIPGLAGSDFCLFWCIRVSDIVAVEIG